LPGKLIPQWGEGTKEPNLIWCRDLNTFVRALVNMRWLVPTLAFASFALAAGAGLMMLRSCSAPELGAIELLAGIAVLLSYGLLLVNIMLALKGMNRY
jgi:hypothetical protein